MGHNQKKLLEGNIYITICTGLCDKNKIKFKTYMDCKCIRSLKRGEKMNGGAGGPTDP